MKKFIKKLFYKRKGNTKKYKLFGLTLVTTTKKANKKVIKILGIKFTNKKKVKMPKLRFSPDLKPIKKQFEYNKQYKRLAIFASFNKDGLIADYVIYYLQGLKKVVDGIIFVTDNPILPLELEKIKDLVIYAQCERHEEYDFGSYKRGYLWAQEKGLLDDADELVLCNDSCYGPVYPFEHMFEEMRKRKCDFWGVISNTDFKFHLQSYFYVFNKAIIKSEVVLKFLKKVKKEKSFWDVVYKYEFELTDCLLQQGFKCDAFLPNNIPEIKSAICRSGHCNKTVFPLTLIKNYSIPLIKVKCFTNGFTFLLEESPYDVLSFLKTQNSDLYSIIIKDIKNKGFYETICNSNIDYLLKDCKVVSFDVFDTLLIRPYVKPIDLFMHMEKFYHIPGFCKYRVEAEQKARMCNPSKEDITLDDIYIQILHKYARYKEKELLFEKGVLQRHPLNYKLYLKAIEQNKKIVVTSDMYLPTKFIEEVLKSNGYLHLEKVYVSGDCNKTKCSGHLFEKILSDFDIQAEELLHIGDNENSDVRIPNKLGIKSYYAQKYMDYFSQFQGNAKYVNFYNECKCLERSIVVSQIARHQLTNDLSYWEDIGYSLGGPLALGYVQRIIKEEKLNDLDCLLFVSRDGYLLQKVYNLFSDEPLENHYIYAPRILNLKCFGDYGCNQAYLKKLIEILECSFPEIKDAQGMEEKQKLLHERENEIQDYYNKNVKEYRSYLETVNIRGNKIASVDMTTGAFTSAKFLKRFLSDRYCLGFYSATFCNDLSVDYIAYMNRLIVPKKEEGLMMLMELLISAPELPIVDIKNNKPVYKSENKYDRQRIEIISQIEVGVLRFVSDYVNTFRFLQKNQLEDISMDMNLSLLNNYAHAMSSVDVGALKQVYHSTDVANENYVSLFDEIVAHM